MKDLGVQILYLLLLFKCISQNVLESMTAGWDSSRDEADFGMEDPAFPPQKVKEMLKYLVASGLIRKYIITFHQTEMRVDCSIQFKTETVVKQSNAGYRYSPENSIACYTITSRGVNYLVANAEGFPVVDNIKALVGSNHILISNWTQPGKLPLYVRDGDAGAIAFLCDISCFQHNRIEVYRPGSRIKKDGNEGMISKRGGRHIQQLLDTAIEMSKSKEAAADKTEPMFYSRTEVVLGKQQGEDYRRFQINGLLSTAMTLSPILVSDGYCGTGITRNWGAVMMECCHYYNTIIKNHLEESKFNPVFLFRNDKELFDVLYTSTSVPVGREVTQYFKWRKDGSKYDFMAKPMQHFYAIPETVDGILLFKELIKTDFTCFPVSKRLLNSYLEKETGLKLLGGKLAVALNIGLHQMINKKAKYSTGPIDEVLEFESGIRLPVLFGAEMDMQKMNYLIYLLRRVRKADAATPLEMVFAKLNSGAKRNATDPELVVVCYEWQQKYWKELTSRIIFVSDGNDLPNAAYNNIG